MELGLTNLARIVYVCPFDSLSSSGQVLRIILKNRDRSFSQNLQTRNLTYSVYVSASDTKLKSKLSLNGRIEEHSFPCSGWSFGCLELFAARPGDDPKS